MYFTRKTRLVFDGHNTPSPTISTYTGAVSRDSIRIPLTCATLNNIDVYAADIRNTYLQAPLSQKDYIICGPECCLENIGEPALIHRALYSGKTTRRNFSNHL